MENIQFDLRCAYFSTGLNKKNTQKQPVYIQIKKSSANFLEFSDVADVAFSWAREICLQQQSPRNKAPSIQNGRLDEHMLRDLLRSNYSSI